MIDSNFEVKYLLRLNKGTLDLIHKNLFENTLFREYKKDSTYKTEQKINTVIEERYLKHIRLQQSLEGYRIYEVGYSPSQVESLLFFTYSSTESLGVLLFNENSKQAVFYHNTSPNNTLQRLDLRYD